MSEETEDLNAVEEMMLGITKNIVDEGRTGKTTQVTEMLVAVLHHPKRSPKIVLVAVEAGDGMGQEEMQDFCEDAQEYLEPSETISIESYNVAELMTTIHALADGGEE